MNKARNRDKKTEIIKHRLRRSSHLNQYEMDKVFKDMIKGAISYYNEL